MFNIDKYLKRFSKNLDSLEIDKNKIIEVLKKHINLDLQRGDVEIKDYKVIVNTSMVGKNQIFIKKQIILNEIKTNISSKVVDIQ